MVSLSSPMYLPRQSDERDRRNRCMLKNSPTVKGREKRVTWEKAEVASDGTKEKQKRNAMGTGKGDFTVLGHLPKNERDEDRGRLKNIHLSFVCMNVSFLILLLPDYRSFPTAWRSARNRVA